MSRRVTMCATVSPLVFQAISALAESEGLNFSRAAERLMLAGMNSQGVSTPGEQQSESVHGADSLAMAITRASELIKVGLRELRMTKGSIRSHAKRSSTRVRA